jgi:hypothetical protein
MPLLTEEGENRLSSVPILGHALLIKIHFNIILSSSLGLQRRL